MHKIIEKLYNNSFLMKYLNLVGGNNTLKAKTFPNLSLYTHLNKINYLHDEVFEMH